MLEQSIRENRAHNNRGIAGECSEQAAGADISVGFAVPILARRKLCNLSQSVPIDCNRGFSSVCAGPKNSRSHLFPRLKPWPIRGSHCSSPQKVIFLQQ